MPGPPNISVAVPFFAVRNIEKSLNFYVDKSGFKILNQWKPRGRIARCWLQRHAVALMLQESQNGGIEQNERKGKRHIRLFPV